MWMSPDAIPGSGKFYKQHTLEDLLSIQLDPSNYIVRPIFDTHNYKVWDTEFDWGNKLNLAYLDYKRRASSKPWWQPKLNNKWDEFRYALHLKLLKWGVIV